MFLELTKEDSKAVKGAAVLLMVIFHYGLASGRIGIACVGMFAFITGYAQCYKASNKKVSLSTPFSFFLPFYKRYILVSIVVFLVYCSINTYDLDYTVIWQLVSVQMPNVRFDSWWYAFAYTSYCFILFPVIYLMERIFKNMDKLFLLILFALSFTSLSLPLIFGRIDVHPAFNTIWGDVPCLRTLMFVPYYVMGYTLYKSIFLQSKPYFITLVLITLMCIFFPFSLYNIKDIELLRVTSPFIALTLISLYFSRETILSRSLKWFGEISTFLWLVHMPTIVLIRKICPSFFAVIPAFLISILVSYLLSVLCKKISFLR